MNPTGLFCIDLKEDSKNESHPERRKEYNNRFMINDCMFILHTSKYNLWISFMVLFISMLFQHILIKKGGENNLKPNEMYLIYNSVSIN